MARFTIRIELHNATWDDYTSLYQHLEELGITDVIAADGGTWYRLPPAEYNYEGNATMAQVLEAAKQCAAKVVTSYAVLVTEAAARQWVGLPQVRR